MVRSNNDPAVFVAILEAEKDVPIDAEGWTSRAKRENGLSRCEQADGYFPAIPESA